MAVSPSIRNIRVAIANPMALPFVSKLIPRGPGNGTAERCERLGTESGVPQYGVPYGVTLNLFLLVVARPAVQTAGMGVYLRADSKPTKW